MKRACGLLLLLMCACGEPEPELAVAEASLLDDVPEYSATPPVPTAEVKTREDIARDALLASITEANVMDKAEALEKKLVEEVKQLQLRLTPVDVDMGP